MKLVLNRNEVMELKRLVSTMGDICGDDVSRVMEMVDKQITTKKFVISMITGQFTFEVKEEFIVGLLNITNNLAKDCAPVLKACVNLGQALVPTFAQYGPQYKDFMESYKDEEPAKESKVILHKVQPTDDINIVSRETKPAGWDIKSVMTEKTKEVI